VVGAQWLEVRGRGLRGLASLCLLTALGVLGGCGTLLVTPGVPLTGAWGGQHLQATLTDSGGTLQYDCASGTISDPLVPDERGQVLAPGIHSPGHGGPIMLGEVPPQLPARYNGTVNGDRLTLTVTLTETGEKVGTFELVRGQPGLIFRCL
jgi:hypothetical protein